MKTKYIALLAACLVALALPAPVFAILGPSTNDSAPAAAADAGSSSSSVTTKAISAHITSVAGPAGFSAASGAGGPTGLSSGDNPLGLSVWGSGGGEYHSNSRTGHNYDGSLLLTTIGLDKVFGSLLAGVALGYEKLDLTTKYNDGKMRYDGYSLTPYLSYAITKDLLLDASFSYTLLDYTMKDTQVGVGYSDTMDADRQVTTLGVTKYLTLDKLLLSGRVGTMYLNEHQGSYRLNIKSFSTAGIYTWQGSLGGLATYDMGTFKPFLGVTFMKDFIKSGGTTNDMWGADLDLGFNHKVTDALSLGLTGTFGVREDMHKVGGMLNISYNF